MDLTPVQFNDVMKRFPTFELSYETISHKKVSPSYNVCLAIPQGKKCYAWFTFYGENNICFLLDINREKKISKASQINTTFDEKLSLGTLVYGTLLENENGEFNFFVIEDIICFKGISLKTSNLKEKLSFLSNFMNCITPLFQTKQSIVFTLPVMWNNQYNDDFDCLTTLPDKMNQEIPYNTHHIQYRCFTEIKPYLNSVITRKLNFTNTVPEQKKVSTHLFETMPIHMDFSKPQYKYPTVFQVTADIQFDIYHMFAYGKNNKPVYYNVTYIPNYKTSVFMNNLFRIIKENANLDNIEESDDEDEFQNMDEDKYVDINKVLLIECVFSSKFKKWIPLRVVDNNSKIVHISKLIRDKDSFNNNTNQRYNQNGYNPQYRKPSYSNSQNQSNVSQYNRKY